MKKTKDNLLFLLLTLAVALILVFNLGYRHALKKIGQTMCAGKNAYDGYLYFKQTGPFTQLILRCYYLTPTHLTQSETILGQN